MNLNLHPLGIASNFIHTIEKRQGLKIAFDAIAFEEKHISRDQLHKQATPLSKNEYGEFLLKILDKKNPIIWNFCQLKHFHKSKNPS
jgi:dTDP-glucose pyrophosphorylase